MQYNLKEKVLKYFNCLLYYVTQLDPINLCSDFRKNDGVSMNDVCDNCGDNEVTERHNTSTEGAVWHCMTNLSNMHHCLEDRTLQKEKH